MVFQTIGAIVDHFVGAKLRQEVEIVRGGGGYYVCPCFSRELDCEHTDRAGSPVNEDSFAALQVGTIEQPLPRGERPRSGRSPPPGGSDGKACRPPKSTRWCNTPRWRRQQTNHSSRRPRGLSHRNRCPRPQPRRHPRIRVRGWLRFLIRRLECGWSDTSATQSGHPRRMDADEHFPAARLGHRSCVRDQGGSIGGIIKAHDIHRFHGESNFEAAYSAAVCAPFCATERLIMNTSATRGTESAAKTRKVSK